MPKSGQCGDCGKCSGGSCVKDTNRNCGECETCNNSGSCESTGTDGTACGTLNSCYTCQNGTCTAPDQKPAAVDKDGIPKIVNVNVPLVTLSATIGVT